LAKAYWDAIAQREAVNPDKQFNERLYSFTYKVRFMQGSDAPRMEYNQSLINSIKSGEIDQQGSAVLLAAAKGEICVDQLDTWINALKKNADMTMLDALQERLEELESAQE